MLWKTLTYQNSICIQEAISQVATIITVTEHVVISSYVVALCECTLVTSWLFCWQNVSVVLSIALLAGQYTFQVIKKFWFRLSVQQPRPSSPHVHFKEPPVAGEGLNTAKEHGRKSPMVSPIPHKRAVAAQRSTVPSDNRVVVNLPNAWSDVSSTISL